jgi:hypothetical protein|tara:strand:- start:1226 stop:1405 length:180 start_codon:yes stop_codon:yes gene_type:complete
MFAVIYGMRVVGLFADRDEAFAFQSLCARNKGKFKHSCMLEVKWVKMFTLDNIEQCQFG